MYSIDKEHFAAFIGELRKEKGFTQKELAEKLFISDKAVSKWERGLSLPDTALLIPLSEVLDVTVTELLKGERLTKDTKLEIEDVEKIITGTIDISNQEIEEKTSNHQNWKKIFIICASTSILEILFLFLFARSIMTDLYNLITGTIILSFFSGYLCIFIKERLPKYYDENKISSYSDGFLRMNLPFVSFNNTNWPHIIKAGRFWSCAAMIAQPAFVLLVYLILPPHLKLFANLAILPTTLGAFGPMVYNAYKYQ